MAQAVSTLRVRLWLRICNRATGNISGCDKEGFSATEEEFCHLVKRSLPVKPQTASVGSCCLVGAITNGELYIANLGDSRVVLGRKVNEDKKKPVVAERLSTDHNVAVEEVRKEVEALHPDDSHIVIYNCGVWRINGIIQVSRSIGDVYLKKTRIQQSPQFSFGSSDRRDLFLIFASDGLWEQLSDETAVEIVFKNPRAITKIVAN